MRINFHNFIFIKKNFLIIVTFLTSKKIKKIKPFFRDIRFLLIRLEYDQLSFCRIF